MKKTVNINGSLKWKRVKISKFLIVICNRSKFFLIAIGAVDNDKQPNTCHKSHNVRIVTRVYKGFKCLSGQRSSNFIHSNLIHTTFLHIRKANDDVENCGSPAVCCSITVSFFQI